MLLIFSAAFLDVFMTLSGISAVNHKNELGKYHKNKLRHSDGDTKQNSSVRLLGIKTKKI